MKKIKAHIISTIILWICTLTALIIFGFFYAVYIKNPEATAFRPTNNILIYLFILFFLCCMSVVLFSVYKIITGGKDYFNRSFHSLLSIVLLGLLFFTTYQLGSGEPLFILGYQGHENTFHWLKVSDMWIYSISVLLGLTILAVFVGIIWSYLKKK